MPDAVDFRWLSDADLVVELVYEGGRRGTVADDPLAVLLPVGNQGGFRYRGSPTRGDVKLVVLYTSGHNVDWPDELDVTTGTFTYYGDNRDPGSDLHGAAYGRPSCGRGGLLGDGTGRTEAQNDAGQTLDLVEVHETDGGRAS